MHTERHSLSSGSTHPCLVVTSFGPTLLWSTMSKERRLCWWGLVCPSSHARDIRPACHSYAQWGLLGRRQARHLTTRANGKRPQNGSWRSASDVFSFSSGRRCRTSWWRGSLSAGAKLPNLVWAVLSTDDMIPQGHQPEPVRDLMVLKSNIRERAEVQFCAKNSRHTVHTRYIWKKSGYERPAMVTFLVAFNSGTRWQIHERSC